MKKIYLFAAMAAMLAACSSDDLTVEKQSTLPAESTEGAIDFDVYVGRGLTRGGVDGVVDNDELRSTTTEAGKAGFGVFGYYTDGEPYSAITKPNFFYNQQVKYAATESSIRRWTYTPIKYWPNEFGSDSRSDQVDRVTLFAYLPYVEVDPITGVVKPADTGATEKVKMQKDPTTNIIGMTRNTATGDPFVKYVSTMDPTSSVDLCYGVAANEFTSSNSAINRNRIAKGDPYIDVVKPATDDNSKIFFDFKHATAQLNVTINAKVVDKTTDADPDNDEIDTDHTRIWVRSVTFTGITQKGSLNLNSKQDQPEWYDINGNTKITTGSLTVFDGRKDAKEANDAASNETPATLNAKIVQKGQYTVNSSDVITAPDKATKPGVTTTTLNLFESDNTGDPVFVIPTKEPMRVTIVYDVETVDKNLPYYLSDGKTAGSKVQNTIYKDIETFGNISAGFKYTLHLHLGMRTVDFDAEVTPWQDYGADVDLPSNLMTFEAGSTAPTPYPRLTLPATATTFQFAVSGLDVNEAPNATSSTFSLTGSTLNPTATPVNGAGISIISVSNITENETVKNNGGYWTVNTSNKTVTINVTQLAAPLGLTMSNIAAGKEVTISKTATGSTWAEAITDVTDQNQIKVYKNGMLMSVQSSNPTADNQVKFDDGTLTFKNDFVDDDVVTVWIKAGDAAAESVTKTYNE